MASQSTAQLKSNVQAALDEIWNKGNLSYIDENFASDYVLHDPNYPEQVEGPDGFKEYVTELRTAFSDIDATAEEIVAEGEIVSLRYSWRATHTGELFGVEPTGKQVETTGMAFMRFEDGKRKEDWFLDDFLGLLGQLGVVDVPQA